MQAFTSLQNRVVVITGGGRGFGREIALALARAGAKLVLTVGRNTAELDRTVADANTIASGCCVGIAADVTVPADAARVAALAQDTFGGAEVLFNNAARSPSETVTRFDRTAPAPFWEADPAGYERLVVTNIVGPFLMAQALLPQMLARGFGRIVNFSTSRPTMVISGRGPYGATKAALEASTIIWARDLAGTGVTVNVLLPGGASDTALIPGGIVGTRGMADFRAGQGGDEGRLPGLLPADVIVPPALWLAADESAAWTGRRIVAKDWDPALGWRESLNMAMTAQNDAPVIM